MHLLVRESAGLDETAPAEDLALAPADAVVLSFSDSDLGTLAATWNTWGANRPDLRLANLARLRHPMSVDLFCDQSLPGTKAVLVRLLGGLDYWRYGCEELFACCQQLHIPLAIVTGDGRPDPRLDAYSTLPHADLAALAALLDTGGADNFRAAITGLLSSPSLRSRGSPMTGGGPGRLLQNKLGNRGANEDSPPIGETSLCKTDSAETPTLILPTGERDQVRPASLSLHFPAPVLIPPYGLHSHAPALTPAATATAVIVCYRSVVLAADTAPLDALADALALRGLAATILFIPSLKVPDAARWMRRELTCRAPDVILNATAFSARDDANSSPLDAANCPVLQVVMAQLSREAWAASARGLTAADIAMNVAFPELDGRIAGGVISFKQPTDFNASLGFSPLLHRPDSDAIAHAASLAAAWARLRTLSPANRKVALVLSTYPGRPDQIAHAVGLDGPASAMAIIDALGGAGYRLDDAPTSARELLTVLTGVLTANFSLADYEVAFAGLPEAFRTTVIAAWGAPAGDPAIRNGAFQLPVRRYGKLVLALQPERGDAGDRKSGYHDPSLPPRHGYIAFYLWLRHVARIDALIHLGAHGTLEWLPGKAVALSPSCAPAALLGPTPVIYPFIVNDPGEAAQAKRRIGAVTLGHQTPPLVATELDGKLLDIERLVDEFSGADGLDPRRRATLMQSVADAVERAGLAGVCGLTQKMATADKLARIDAFLCDVKELSIRDGLHILDATELDAILRALDGRFIQPGPSGAPSRGRADVLPTGRNLYSIDPRGVPTQTAMTNGQRAASAIMDRYAQDHGEWPRSIVMDLWGSATLRTGGEELATALALLGVKPVWDPRSFRVCGYEIIPPPLLDRPRVDVSLRISGLFRDMFATQLTLFDQAVQHVASLNEDAEINPLCASSSTAHRDRIFGAPTGSYGTGVMPRIDRGDWNQSTELGEAYLANSATRYRGEGSVHPDDGSFAERVRDANAFVHIQDHHETDLLTGSDYAAHEGAFAAAAASLGNTSVTLYHGDTGNPDAPRVRTLDEECARIVSGRAVSPRWIAGQMRHGFRGAAEIAATVDAAFAFAATSGAITSGAFEQLYDAYLGNADVAAFIRTQNPAAFDALRMRFEEAIARGLWQPRRNDLSPLIAQAAQ